MSEERHREGGAMAARDAEATAAMHASPRCGAKTRKGTPCDAPAVAGKKRCRMHGGAPGSGAPKGNQNALKHGEYSASTKAMMKRVQDTWRRARTLLDKD